MRRRSEQAMGKEQRGAVKNVSDATSTPCAGINFALIVQTKRHHCGENKNSGLHTPVLSE